MSKRYTDTNIWSEDWFIDMPLPYKMFWFYIKDNCDHAGIFKPNIKKYCLLNEVKIDLYKALEYLNSGKDRIRVLDNGHWLLEGFIVFTS